jgi:hypothetical protein
MCGRCSCLPVLERWREAELFACAAAASSSAFSCWRTRCSSEVAASEQPRSNIAVMVRFCDARLKSGRASASALALASMLAPSLARRSLLRVGPRYGGVGARARGCSATGRRSRRSLFPSRGYSCTGMSYAGCRSRGSGSILSSS